MIRRKPRRLVVQAAAKELAALPPTERADLIEGIALLLWEAEGRELARHTVGLIRQAEEHQRKLFQYLTNLV